MLAKPTTIPYQVKVGSDTPRLPDIIAAEFALCGQVTVTEKPSKSFTIQELSMKLKDLKGKSEKIIKIKQDSSFCFFVSPGKRCLKNLYLVFFLLNIH